MGAEILRNSISSVLRNLKVWNYLMKAETLDDRHKEEESCWQSESFGNTLSTAKTKEADVLILSNEFSLGGQKSIWVKLPRVLKHKQRTKVKKSEGFLVWLPFTQLQSSQEI